RFRLSGNYPTATVRINRRILCPPGGRRGRSPPSTTDCCLGSRDAGELFDGAGLPGSLARTTGEDPAGCPGRVFPVLSERGRSPPRTAVWGPGATLPDKACYRVARA